jgi:hypothetical protein
MLIILPLTLSALQILTHMKAKLAFIECENEALQEELHQLEAALAGKRDELASLKSTRDRLWQQQRQLKQDSVFVTNPMLLQDMQVGGLGTRTWPQHLGSCSNVRLIVCTSCLLQRMLPARSLIDLAGEHKQAHTKAAPSCMAVFEHLSCSDSHAPSMKSITAAWL